MEREEGNEDEPSMKFGCVALPNQRSEAKKLYYVVHVYEIIIKQREINEDN